MALTQTLLAFMLDARINGEHPPSTKLEYSIEFIFIASMGFATARLLAWKIRRFRLVEHPYLTLTLIFSFDIAIEIAALTLMLYPKEGLWAQACSSALRLTVACNMEVRPFRH